MPALRFLALATLAFVLPGGAFLWYQQLARLEREAVRVLRGPELELAEGARVTWRVALGASTEDQAWMDCQGQPRLRVPVPGAVDDGLRLRASARYVADGALPDAPAFVGGAGPVEATVRGGWVDLGPLWLNYLQPLEVDVEVVAVERRAGAAPAPTHPVLAGAASADYELARKLDRTVFIAFVCIGAFGVLLLGFVERHRTFLPGTAGVLSGGNDRAR